MIPSSPLDDPALSREWLAVCQSADVGERPLRVLFLGEPVVLWRSPEGLAAFRDLCIHRGTALSLGRVEDGTLVCPYHGWRFAADGRCVHIPAQPELGIPTKARAASFNCREHLGLVWLRADGAEGEPPPFPEFDRPGFRTIVCGPYDVMAEAPRVVENFLDVSHLMWVHEGYLGSPEHAEIPDYRVHRRPDGLESDPIDIRQPDPDGRGRAVVNRYVYEVLGPLTARFRKTDPGSEEVFAMLLHATPTGERRSRAYALLARNYALDTPDAVFRDFQDKVFGQDEAILASQRPEELPLDLAAELHIRSDRLAIAYRRFLADLGVRTGVA